MPAFVLLAKADREEDGTGGVEAQIFGVIRPDTSLANRLFDRDVGDGEVISRSAEIEDNAGPGLPCPSSGEFRINSIPERGSISASDESTPSAATSSFIALPRFPSSFEPAVRNRRRLPAASAGCSLLRSSHSEPSIWTFSGWAGSSNRFE